MRRFVAALRCRVSLVRGPCAPRGSAGCVAESAAIRGSKPRSRARRTSHASTASASSPTGSTRGVPRPSTTSPWMRGLSLRLSLPQPRTVHPDGRDRRPGQRQDSGAHPARRRRPPRPARQRPGALPRTAGDGCAGREKSFLSPWLDTHGAADRLPPSSCRTGGLFSAQAVPVEGQKGGYFWSEVAYAGVQSSLCFGPEQRLFGSEVAYASAESRAYFGPK